MDTGKKRFSFHFRASSQRKKITWLALATPFIIVGVLLLSTTSSWNNVLHSSHASANAAARTAQNHDQQIARQQSLQSSQSSATTASGPRINIPFFTSAVPFNQTAIFWFGSIDSTKDYTDVRIGYNSSELYIALNVIDHHNWYDTNVQSPDLSKGDNASIYINTINNASSLDQHSYKFQAGLTGYQPRSNYQQAYSAKGTTWITSNAPFTPVAGTRGHGFNGPDDKGWSMIYHIPFSSFGMSTPPAQGTLWKLSVRVHNRYDANNTITPDIWWPTTAGETNPSSWGDLRFGMPTYQPPHANGTSMYTVRNRLNNQVVTDGMVGGGLGCGSGVTDPVTQWGYKTHPGEIHINIHNEQDIADWTCFSKFYITFPLSALPKGKGLMNAKVTLYEYGNGGPQGQPDPSYLQVGVVGQDWNPATLCWNNAPLEQENISNIFVPTKSKPVIPWPGLAITWDVSSAAAQAYATGQPLRLAFYSTDNQYNSAKYFTSSFVGDWDANGRPTLQVALG